MLLTEWVNIDIYCSFAKNQISNEIENMIEESRKTAAKAGCKIQYPPFGEQYNEELQDPSSFHHQRLVEDFISRGGWFRDVFLFFFIQIVCWSYKFLMLTLVKGEF